MHVWSSPSGIGSLPESVSFKVNNLDPSFVSHFPVLDLGKSISFKVNNSDLPYLSVCAEDRKGLRDVDSNCDIMRLFANDESDSVRGSLGNLGFAVTGYTLGDLGDIFTIHGTCKGNMISPPLIRNIRCGTDILL